MTIRTRITLLFISIVAGLMAIFCAVIYLESEYHRQEEYKIRLRKEALATSTIFFKKQEISTDILKLLDKNDATVLSNEEVVILDSNNHIVYESGNDSIPITPENIELIRQNLEYYWRDKSKELYGIVVENNGEKYVSVASAVDTDGNSKQKNLAFMLILGGLSMLIISWVMGWLFAGRALWPLQQIIRQIDKIRASRLNLRLDEGNKTDEIAQLSMRFNQMLNRLEHSFKTQKAFVSHASHELRTPLTSITGQIQVSLLADDNPADLKLMIQSVLEDVQQLNKLTNNLLELTSIDSEDSKIKLSLVNLLEVIWQVRSDLMKKNQKYNILISLDEDADFQPEIKANESLLYTAFLNLTENGAKFSPQNTVQVKIKKVSSGISIIFHNDEPLIPPTELDSIFEPFRRGSNAKNTKGHGVGLSLTKRIIELHEGQIDVESTKETGVNFTVYLPSVS